MVKNINAFDVIEQFISYHPMLAYQENVQYGKQKRRSNDKFYSLV